MSKTIKLIPKFKQLIGDTITPVTAYLALRDTDTFLLESVVGGDQVARFSVIGLDPFCTFKSHHGKHVVTREGRSETIKGNPISILEDLVYSYDVEGKDQFSFFMGGAVGFFSWESIGCIENISFSNKDILDVPFIHYLFPRTFVIFDHAQRLCHLITLAEKNQEKEAAQRLEEVEKKLQAITPSKWIEQNDFSDTDLFEAVQSNYQKESFLSDVERVKQHIVEGDVFQLVLSQRFSIESKKDPFDVYRHLRVLNPSPYMFFFEFEDYSMVGSSPEILSRVENKSVFVRPIAGTRPRIKGQEQALMDELFKDEKEKAEHIMLVDLGRNDLGRVCDYHSIQVKDLMTIEMYSHVMHMVTQVEGQLKDGKTAFDVFKATFPAGTLSGAPKIRAVELIESIEFDKRGPYGGALGYFDFSGNMDLCIIIRTIIAAKGQLTIQAGAGIVADSDPLSEFEETKIKAKGMIEACL